jgi:peptide/nickel transport system substrate-binding protein
MSASKTGKWMSLFSLIVAVALLVAGCGPTPAPEVVEKVVTQEVEKVVTQVVQETVIVEGTPEVVERVVTEVVEKVVTPTPEPEESVSTEPVYGGVFKAAMAALPPSMDSMSTVAGATMIWTTPMFEHLVDFGEDYSIVPMLAESWDLSEDGKTYTFTLRQGRMFHNGKEMTCEDVLASFERYLAVSARAAQFEILDSYECLDDYTFVTTLTTPSAAWLGTMATPASDLAVFPKEIIEGKAAGELAPEDLIGTGPYKLKEFQPDQYLYVERFEDYEPLPGERDGLGGAKYAYFDEIQFIFVPEPGARVAGLEVGDYDWIEEPPESEFDRFQADPNIEVHITKPSFGGYLLFNHANDFSGDVTFRQAVLAALDMEALGMAAKSGHRELFDLNECIWPQQTTWYFEDDYSMSQYNQNNPEKAKELLAEAGYNGEEIVLVATRDYEYMYKQIMSLADQLKDKAEMNVKVELYDWPGTLAKWAEESGWHIGVTGNTTLELLNPNAASGYWGSAGTHPVRVHYSNPDMDEAFRVLDSAPTQDERKEALRPIQHIFWEDLPNIKTVEFYKVEATGADIKGHVGWYRPRFHGVWRQQ